MNGILREGREPLYWQIKKNLVSRIAGMRENDRFPSETELMNEFQVSRGTVKQAIMELVHEGYLYRIQGKGTFVSPPRIVRGFSGLPSFTEDILRKGYEPKSIVRVLRLETPPVKAAEALDLPADAETWRIERVVTADDVPIALVTSYLRADVYPDLGAHPLQRSLYQTLHQAYGRVPVTARDTYEAQIATGALTKALSIRSGDPVLYSERTAYLDNGLPVEYVQSYMRGDRFTIQVNIGQEGDEHGSPVGIRPRNVRS